MYLSLTLYIPVSALQYHPLSPTVYLLISYNHLHPSSPIPRSIIPSSSKTELPSLAPPEEPIGFSLEGTSPARTTLLLGLRLLPQSRDLWREYIKLELGWVEALRRRWKVLGIENRSEQPSEVSFQGNDEELLAGQGSFGPEGEQARKAILAGQLVVHAISSALDAIPADEDTAFREELLGLLRTYPSPLRTQALGVVYDDLELTATRGGKAGAEARLLALTKHLYDRPYDSSRRDEGTVVLQGVELVEEIGRIGKEIRRHAKGAKGSVWADVAEGWLGEQLDQNGDNLGLVSVWCSNHTVHGADLEKREYLFSILNSLTKPALRPSPTLLLIHLDHLARSPTSSGSVILATARAHAEIHPAHCQLQRIHLKAEVDHELDAKVVRLAFQSVIKAITRSGFSESEQGDVRSIWMSWTDFEERLSGDNKQNIDQIWDRILHDSLKLGGGITSLHSSLLSRYFALTLQRDPPRSPIKTLELVCAKYGPTPVFFATAFTALSAQSGDRYDELSKLYEAWRVACNSAQDRVEAVLVWARWLLHAGKGREANLAVDAIRREVRSDDEVSADLESGWSRLLDQKEGVDRQGEEVNDTLVTLVTLQSELEVDESDDSEDEDSMDQAELRGEAEKRKSASEA